MLPSRSFFFSLFVALAVMASSLVNAGGVALHANVVKSQVALHNAKRAIHGAPKVHWDDKLAKTALKFASKCPKNHSNGKYGENMAWGAPPSKYSSAALFKMWYEEGKGYNYDRKTFSEKAGHFTQVVWKDTSKIGCAMVTCPKDTNSFGDEYRLLVCEYSKPGNVQGEFTKNVLPARKMSKHKKTKSSSSSH